MLANVLLAVLALKGEQWNGPEGAEKCPEGGLSQLWANSFDTGERAFSLMSQSYVCEGVDCDGTGGFFAKYAWKCAAKGKGGVGSLDVAAPYVGYVINGPGPEFHSYKPCFFFDEMGIDLPPGSEVDLSDNECEVPKAELCEYPDPPASDTKLPHIEKDLPHWYARCTVHGVTFPHA
jgi:hypothetical protein